MCVIHSVVSDSFRPQRSPPGSSIHGILQARILEWIAIPFSKGIFPTQGSNLDLLHCKQILYCLNHQVCPIKPCPCVKKNFFVRFYPISFLKINLFCCIAGHRLFSCAVWALVVVACGLSFPSACGILVPPNRDGTHIPALQSRFLITGLPGSTPPHEKLNGFPLLPE